MQSLYRQRGLGAIGWLLVLLVFSFFLTCFFKLFPVYLSAYEIHSIMQELSEDSEARKGGVGKLRDLMQRRFDTNRIEVIKAKDVKISEKKGTLFIDATYETDQIPLIWNIYVVVKFDDFIYEVPAES